MIPDRWLRVRVELPEGTDRGVVADLLLAHGAGAVQEDGAGLTTYVAPPDDPDRVVRAISAALEREALGPAEVSWAWQPHEPWAEMWKQGLTARRIGRRLVVSPSWIEVPTEEDRAVVRIDPGMAFGTAEHATTRGCLEFLDVVIRGRERLLDVGTGSGILAIAAVRLGAAFALGVEADPMACAAARGNVVRNGVEARVRIDCRTLPTRADFGLGRFDVVVANMVETLLTPRLEAMTAALASAGTLIVGGIEAERAGPFAAEIERVGLAVEDVRTEEGWWSARATRLMSG